MGGLNGYVEAVLTVGDSALMKTDEPLVRGLLLDVVGVTRGRAGVDDDGGAVGGIRGVHLALEFGSVSTAEQAGAI